VRYKPTFYTTPTNPILHSSATTSTTPSASATSTYSAATPTFSPISGCSNSTLFTSTYAQGLSGSSAGLNFTAYCNYGNLLDNTKASNASQAYVYSFADCMEVCAGFNYLHDNNNCTIAVYQSSAARPSNCWVGSLDGVTASSLVADEGMDVALLESTSS
jgi:hypothetical protein